MLYNVMNGSHYDNPDDVEMVTLDGGISLSVRNDRRVCRGCPA